MVPGDGAYTFRVHIDAPTFHRHDRKNGLRDAEPVEVEFRGATPAEIRLSCSARVRTASC